MPKRDLRDAILDAVNRVVVRNGLNGLTLEDVAAEAGLSKGGVLYYFPTKQALFFGMLDRYETGFFARREEVLATLPPGPSRLLRATVMVMLADQDVTREGIPNYATVLDDEVLRARVGDFKKRIFKEIVKECPDSGKVSLAVFAVDGLWMDRRFKPPLIAKKHRAAAIRTLLEFIDSLA